MMSFGIRIVFEPVQGDSGEGNFFVGTFFTAFKEAADGFVGQDGET